jgi:ABC-type nitrate/sulfonate/bicarbonate transport system substrate-binding protein
MAANVQKMITRTADSKGRVVLGKRFANRTVIVKVVPEREAWLYKNPKALKSVLRGLAEARAGHFTAGPDLEADAALISELMD